MPRRRTANVNEAVKQAAAENQVVEASSTVVENQVEETSQHPELEANIPAGNPMSRVRDKLRVETKQYVAGGIVQGITEILGGDFSGVETELTDAVDEIVEGFASPKFAPNHKVLASPSLFTLTPAK